MNLTFKVILRERYQINGDFTVSIRTTQIQMPQYKRLQPNAGREQAYRESDQETISWKDNQYS